MSVKESISNFLNLVLETSSNELILILENGEIKLGYKENKENENCNLIFINESKYNEFLNVNFVRYLMSVLLSNSTMNTATFNYYENYNFAVTIKSYFKDGDTNIVISNEKADLLNFNPEKKVELISIHKISFVTFFDIYKNEWGLRIEKEN